MCVCRQQKGYKSWHRAQPRLVVMAHAVQNTCLQYQLQGDVMQSLLAAGLGPCELWVLTTRAGPAGFTPCTPGWMQGDAPLCTQAGLVGGDAWVNLG